MGLCLGHGGVGRWGGAERMVGGANWIAEVFLAIRMVVASYKACPKTIPTLKEKSMLLSIIKILVSNKNKKEVKNHEFSFIT